MELQCYNKGCGQKFNSGDNPEESCKYHPGQPIFHDADKKWSCCNKRSRDFTAFLSMPGCTTGPHNGTKPAEPVKNEKVDESPIIEIKPRAPTIRKDRPSVDADMTILEPVITSSLEKLLAQNKDKSSDSEVQTDLISGIAIGEGCKRNGCNSVYEGESSSLNFCKYHSGGPVFHEGMKYWSCCKRKTSDFTSFLAQEGCTVGKHLWKAEEKQGGMKSDCRFDWHQTSTDVCVTFYAKAAFPAQSTVSVGPVRLTVDLYYGNNLRSQLDFELAGLVDPSRCSATFAATKVEIQMKKDEVLTWPKLKIDKAPVQTTETDDDLKDNSDADLLPDIDTVDLSDL